MLRTIAVVNRFVGTVAAVVITAFLFALPTHAQSTIKASLCADSQITITEPLHDGTVNNPLVHFSGTVAHASQIEVYIDNNYSTQIPLASGAMTYASDITVGVGTHTVKLVAIGICSTTSNAEAAHVVTYTPAKVGGQTSTNISENGSHVGSTAGNQQSLSPLSPSINNTLQSIAKWLNFKIDNQQESQSRLSFVRAITLAAGLALSVFGMALVVVDWFSKATAAWLLPTVIGQGRILLFRIIFRTLGAVTVLLALFL